MTGNTELGTTAIDLQTTVESPARVTVPGSPDPVIGQLIGLDSRRPQLLNRVSLRAANM